MNCFRLKIRSFVFIIIFLSLGFCFEGYAGSDLDRLNKKEIIHGFLLQWSSHIKGYETYFARLKTEGDRNAVQYLMDMGRAAFAKNDHRFSSACFLACIDYISDIYSHGSDASAKRKKFFQAAEKSKSLWFDEEVKYFRGEPYERMMLYYYQGLNHYFINNDIETARAYWENGIFQDALAEEEQHRCDFLPLEILSAWSAKKIGSSGLIEKSEKQLQKLNSPLLIPEKNAKLLIIESGSGPVKLQKGEFGSLLTFSCSNKRPQQISVSIDGQQNTCRQVGDVCFQANTRGGRWIDGILAHKVVFKGEWENITKKYSSKPSLMAGGAMFHASGLAKQISKKIKTKADIRGWSNLKNNIWMSYVETPFDTISISVEYSNGKRINKKISGSEKEREILWVQF